MIPPVSQLEPYELFDWLAGLPASQDCLVECGAGRGEISAYLNGRLSKVVATDKTPPRQTLTKVIAAPAETIPCADTSVDLLLSMQALHHFDVADHLKEASRVLRTGGVFAALCWGEICLPEHVHAAYEPVFRSVENFWEAERNWVLSGYADLSFPGRAIPLPKTRMRKTMTLPDLDAEIAHWSAVQAALVAGHDIEDPDDLHISDEDRFEVSWPIRGQVFVVS